MSAIKSRMKQHSRIQVEVKNHYPINLDDKGKIGYTLDIYLLSPYTLDVNDSTYSRRDILSDLHIYTRYTIYDTTLDKIVCEGNEHSPLKRIEDLIDERDFQNCEFCRKLNYEFRVLANTFLNQMDQKESYFRKIIEESSDQVNLKPEVIDLYEKLELILTRFRNLESLMMIEGLPEDVQKGYNLADETISLTIERVLFPLLNLFIGAEGATGKKRINRLLKQEIKYRKNRGYAILEEGNLTESAKERSVYREGTLKKWAQSVNYMDKKSSTLNRNTGHILAAVAAAIAMSFAVLATLYANRFFVTYSLPWIAIAIFSYSLKDRIKEGLRAIFQKLLPILISDKTDNLYDSLITQPVGRARLTVEHKKASELPDNITSWYQGGEHTFRSILPEENILHLRRQISIKRNRLKKHHTRLTSITEIFRLNLNRFIKNMDDPDKRLWYYKENKPVEVKGSRVYRLKFAICITRVGEEPSLFFYKVHMQQNGIVRIKEDRC